MVRILYIGLPSYSLPSSENKNGVLKMNSITLRNENICEKVDRILGKNIALVVPYSSGILPVLNLQNRVDVGLTTERVYPIIHSLDFDMRADDFANPDSPAIYEKMMGLAKKYCLDGEVCLEPDFWRQNPFNDLSKFYLLSSDPIAEQSEIFEAIREIAYFRHISEGGDALNSGPALDYLNRNYLRFHNSGAFEANGLSEITRTSALIPSELIRALEKGRDVGAREQDILTYGAVCLLNEGFDTAYVDDFAKRIADKNAREQICDAMRLRKDGKL